MELLASEGAHGAQDTVDNKVDRHSEEEHKCEHRDQERAEKADKREPDLWFRGTGAGGKAEYHLLPPLGNDGHFLMFLPEATPVWAPIVARFLQNSQFAKTP